MNFERIETYPDAIIPLTSGNLSAKYIFCAAEDTYIPSYTREIVPALNNAYLFSTEAKMRNDPKWQELFDLQIDESQNIYPQLLSYYPNMKPTSVPTGIKINLDSNKIMEISIDSSLAKNSLLFMIDAPKIIDASYNNSETEGHICIQLINLSPFGYTIKKNQVIAQGIILQGYNID